jgi:lincosamide nucleotidyltransferase A/C/D/E
MMTAGDVLAVLDAVEGAGLRVWLDGGWGVDALVGRQHRDHDDLDVVVELVAVAGIIEALAPLGFSTAEDHLPTRMVLRAPEGRQVDVHPVTFDDKGTGWQAGAGPGGGDAAYPADGFTTGSVAGRPVGCLSAGLQVQHHRGYEPTATDRHDLRLLADAFGLSLPPPYG